MVSRTRRNPPSPPFKLGGGLRQRPRIAAVLLWRNPRNPPSPQFPIGCSRKPKGGATLPASLRLPLRDRGLRGVTVSKGTEIRGPRRNPRGLRLGVTGGYVACLSVVWAPPRPVWPVRPRARGREIALGATGPRPLRGPALRQPRHVSCVCSALARRRGIRGVAKHLLRNAPPFARQRSPAIVRLCRPS